MEPVNFAYWLNGFVEMNGGVAPNDTQWEMIKDHLKTVFDKLTPIRSEPQKGWEDKAIETKLFPDTDGGIWRIPRQFDQPFYSLTEQSGFRPVSFC